MSKSIHFAFGSGTTTTVGGVPIGDVWVTLTPTPIAVTVGMPSPRVGTGVGFDEYFVDPANGSDSYDGKSWGQAFATCSQAASAAAGPSRVWLAPGTHTITSTVTYSNPILWVGPPKCAGQLQGKTGNVWITGSGLQRYFDIGSDAQQTNGGGFINVGFDTDGVSKQKIRITSVTNFHLISCYAKQANNKDDPGTEMLRVFGVLDTSGLVMRDCDTHGSPLLAAGPTGDAHDWQIDNCYSQKAPTPAYFAQPTIDLYDGDFDGLTISGGYIETNTSPAVSVDMTGVTGQRRVYMTGALMERCSSPAVKLINCHLVLLYPSGQSTNGSYWGSNTDGYVMVKSGRLSGDLVSGVNT